MPKDKRPLPKPPKTPFGRKGPGSDLEDEELVADKMGMAMAKGEMDSFVEKELGGNENAARLASMMAGMTGMGQAFAPPSGQAPKEAASGVTGRPEDTGGPGADPEIKGIAPSDEIMKATMSGDVKKLTALLKEAASKHGTEAGSAHPKETAKQAIKETEPTAGDEAEARDIPFMEKLLLEQLIKMAKENDVSVDWLMQRALKLYLQDYKNTGRM